MTVILAQGFRNACYVGATGGTVTICRGRIFAYAEDCVLCALRLGCEHENSLRRRCAYRRWRMQRWIRGSGR